jgi:hypothetical protein
MVPRLAAVKAGRLGGRSSTMKGASGEESIRDRVRLHVFGHAAETGRVPQPPEIAQALRDRRHRSKRHSPSLQSVER